jgi:DNA-binding transcriptional MocR family regulator
MTATARIGATQLARALGDWRRHGVGYSALAGAVRGLVRDGRLGLQVRLPAERVLAAELGASRTTVTAAYRLLRDQGYLESRRGSGSHTRLPEGERMSTGLWAPDDDADIDLGCAAPVAPPELVPAAERAVGRLSGYAVDHGYHPMGIPALRSAIAEMYTRRGIPTGTAEILVTTGAQQAIDLLVRLLVAPGERVLIESPSYPNALSAMAFAHARPDTVGVTGGDWDLDPMLPALAAGRFRLAYLIPDFQNPTGALMPVGDRERLVRAARAGNTTLVVDETFVDLVYDDTPMPPAMAAVDRNRRVVTVGGLKAYWGGLRIGWLRATPALVQRLAAVRVASDIGGAVIDQMIAVELLDDADAIMARRRTEIAAQRDALAAALHRYLPDWRFRLPRGGMSLWAELDTPISSALGRAAEAYGVRLAPGPRFGAEGTLERFVRLPLTLPAATLAEAARRLAAASADLDAVPPHRLTGPSIVA